MNESISSSRLWLTTLVYLGKVKVKESMWESKVASNKSSKARVKLLTHSARFLYKVNYYSASVKPRWLTLRIPWNRRFIRNWTNFVFIERWYLCVSIIYLLFTTFLRNRCHSDWKLEIENVSLFLCVKQLLVHTLWNILYT